MRKVGKIIKRTREKAEETRQNIFKAALTAFHEKGFSSTTLEDIAKLAGISRGAIYWNFKNKQDLYVCLLREYFSDRFYQALHQEYEPNHSAIESIKDLMRSYFQVLIMEEENRRFMEILRFKTEIKTDVPEVLEVQQEIDNTIKTEFARLVQLGIDKGELREDVNGFVLSMAALSFLNGIEDSWLLNPKEFILEEHLEEMIIVFIDGIIKR